MTKLANPFPLPCPTFSFTRAAVVSPGCCVSPTPGESVLSISLPASGPTAAPPGWPSAAPPPTPPPSPEPPVAAADAAGWEGCSFSRCSNLSSTPGAVLRGCMRGGSSGNSAGGKAPAWPAEARSCRQHSVWVSLEATAHCWLASRTCPGPRGRSPWDQHPRSASLRGAAAAAEQHSEACENSSSAGERQQQLSSIQKRVRTAALASCCRRLPSCPAAAQSLVLPPQLPLPPLCRSCWHGGLTVRVSLLAAAPAGPALGLALGLSAASGAAGAGRQGGREALRRAGERQDAGPVGWRQEV